MGRRRLCQPDDVAFARDHTYDRSEGTWVAVLMRGYAQRALRQSLVQAINKSEMIPGYVKPIALSLLNQSDQLLIGYDRAVRAVVQQDGVIDKAMLKTKLAAQLSASGVPDSAAQMLGGFMEDRGFFDSIALTVEQNGEVFGAYKSLGQGGVPVRVFEAFQGKGFSGLVADKKLTLEQLRRVSSLGTSPWWPEAGALRAAKGYSKRQLVGRWPLLYRAELTTTAAQTVTLRNPWGAKPDPDGIFTIPARQPSWMPLSSIPTRNRRGFSFF
jgi:hypothetical protein